MSDIVMALENLVDVIKKSKEYNDYVDSRAALMMYPELAAKVNEFRDKNFQLQEKKDDIFESTFKLQDEYAEYINQPVARAFLTAESAMCKIFQKINYKLLDDLQFELES